MTGEARYEQQYWDILAIRDGKKPMPEGVSPVCGCRRRSGKPSLMVTKGTLAGFDETSGFQRSEIIELSEPKAIRMGLVNTGNRGSER